MTSIVSNKVVGEWAAVRADDAGRLARYIVEIRRDVSDLVSVCEDCEAYFDNKADADCDQDGYHPNREMSILSRLKTALGATTISALLD